MANRIDVIRPAHREVGTPEWFAHKEEYLRSQLKVAAMDCRPIGETTPLLRREVLARGDDWERYCHEKLRAYPAWVDAIEKGIEAIRNGGHVGAISERQALRATEAGRKALEAPALSAAEAGKRGGRGNKKAPDIIRSFGTSADYLAKRLARDAPAIAKRLAAGEFKSVRAAAIEAGIVAILSPVLKARGALRKLATEDRIAVLAEECSAEELSAALERNQASGKE